MKIYIDFDSTLFHTKNFTNTLIDLIATHCNKQNKTLEKTQITGEIQELFKGTKSYTFYELADFFAEKYNLDAEPIIENIHQVLASGKGFVFEDSERFLKRMSSGNTLILFTYSAKERFSFQLEKVMGSGLADYFDNILITSKNKHELDIDYTDGIFIDDNVDVLAGLCTKKPKKIYRIRREGTKYYDKAMPNGEEIEEIYSLDEIYNLSKEIK